jgi:tRNA-dihydrouridine synthase C
MEGLLDFVLRDILTRVGGIDRCVSEFIRITDQLLPERVFIRVVPELLNGSRTPAGVPVRAQLLGSDAACMADNAARLAAMGSAGIDLNFGCPANIVNRHGGGAALLQDPQAVGRIVAAVRRAVPAVVPVSAKMRLGFQDDALAEDCARAIDEASRAAARPEAESVRIPQCGAPSRRVGTAAASVDENLGAHEDARHAVARHGWHTTQHGAHPGQRGGVEDVQVIHEDLAAHRSACE